MKKVALHKVSAKQSRELRLRAKLKKELIEMLPIDDAGRKICPQICEGCDRVNIPFPGLNLIHKKALSSGGKTDKVNCEIGCQKYHGIKYHGLKIM